MNIETKLIESPTDILKLDIIDWNRLNGYWENPAAALETIASWLVGIADYTIYHTDLRAAPQRDDWPGWRHVGNHEQLGHLFWNWFHWKRKGELHFSDSPDFHGILKQTKGKEAVFYGDIGKVSASTFSFTLRRLDAHDIWISIPDCKTQVIIEPFISLREVAAQSLY